MSRDQNQCNSSENQHATDEKKNAQRDNATVEQDAMDWKSNSANWERKSPSASTHDQPAKSFGALLCSSQSDSRASNPQTYFQLPSVSGINGFTGSSPMFLTRQTSLPTYIARTDYQRHEVPAGVISSAPSYLPAPSALNSQMTSLYMSGTSIPQPSFLARHKCHGSVNTLQAPRNSQQNSDNLEISTGYQNYLNSLPSPGNLRSFVSPSDVEHAPYDQKKPSLDSLELEPLYYNFRRDHNEDLNRYRSMDGVKSPSYEFAQFDKAFESLDKLIPEMDQDLFQPSELDSITSNSHSFHQNCSTYAYNKVNQDHSARGVIHGSIGSNLKILSSFSELVSSSASQRQFRNIATCKISGCERRVRSRGFCKAHGGGRKCAIEGCNKSSQNGDLCIGHGGGKKCKHESCSKAAQSHGLCKAHGGGARCKFPDCTKSSQGGGLCRAHGGGKRCQAVGCQKGAQRGNFCATHGGFRNCKIDGCVRTDRGGGYCEIHRRGRLCKVASCKKLARNQDMCTMHIREERQPVV